MKGNRLAVDIAKGVFQGVVVRGRGRVEWAKRWRRQQFLKALADLEPCLVVMEACGSSHYWGRLMVC